MGQRLRRAPPKTPLGSNPEAAKSTIGLSKIATTDTRVERYSLLNQSLMLVEDFSTSQLMKASTGGTLCSPNGTQFNPPATTTVTYAAAKLKSTSPSKLSISWFDTTKNQWVNPGGTVNTSTMTV